MIWYVYAVEKSNEPVFFDSRDKALRWKIDRSARTGEYLKIRWCHRESVPDHITIH